MGMLSKFLMDGVPLPFPTTNGSWAVLCFVPKSGSSAWKGLVVESLERQGYRSINTSAPTGQPLPSFGNPIMPLPYDVSHVNVRTAPWLMFVRHPISRLLSAYLDEKVRLSMSRDMVFGMGMYSPYQTRKDFESFVHAVTSAMGFRLNGQLRLQSELCALHEGADYHYLRAETMGFWYRQIICMLSLQQAHHAESFRSEWRAPCIQAPCCFVRTQDCGCKLNCDGGKGSCNAIMPGLHPEASFGSFQRSNQSRSSRLEDWYDDDLADRVNRWAEMDYKRFGYLPWRPGQQLQERIMHSL